MTEPDLVIARCDIQRHLERRRAVGADHTTGRPEVHRIRRRRDRHLPHRATGDDVPRLQAAGPGTRGISGARAISAQPWLDSGERDDDQGRRREGGKVAAEHALRHRARRTVSRPPFGWTRLGGGACNTAQGDLRHSNGGSAAHRSGGLDSGPATHSAKCEGAPERRSEGVSAGGHALQCRSRRPESHEHRGVGQAGREARTSESRPGNASQRAVQLPDIRRPQPQRRQRPAIVRRQTAPGASRRVVRIRHAQAGSHARAAQRSRQGATEGTSRRRSVRACLAYARVAASCLS